MHHCVTVRRKGYWEVISGDRVRRGGRMLKRVAYAWPLVSLIGAVRLSALALCPAFLFLATGRAPPLPSYLPPSLSPALAISRPIPSTRVEPHTEAGVTAPAAATAAAPTFAGVFTPHPLSRCLAA